MTLFELFLLKTFELFEHNKNIEIHENFPEVLADLFNKATRRSEKDAPLIMHTLLEQKHVADQYEIDSFNQYHEAFTTEIYTRHEPRTELESAYGLLHRIAQVPESMLARTDLAHLCIQAFMFDARLNHSQSQDDAYTEGSYFNLLNSATNVTREQWSALKNHLARLLGFYAFGNSDEPSAPPVYTATHLAVLNNNINGIKMDEINTVTNDDEKLTPLHLAVSHGTRRTVSTLLLKGGDPSVTTLQGLTLLHLAARHGNADVITLLLIMKNPGVSAQDKDGHTPLYHALTNFRAKPSEKNRPQLIEWANERTNRVNCLNALIQGGAILSDKDVSARNHENIMPLLSIVIQEGFFELALKMLDNPSTDWKSRDYLGYTPLHFAAIKGSPEIVEKLLDMGADPKATTAYEKTAAQMTLVPQIKFLLTKPAGNLLIRLDLSPDLNQDSKKPVGNLLIRSPHQQGVRGSSRRVVSAVPYKPPVNPSSLPFLPIIESPRSPQ